MISKQAVEEQLKRIGCNFRFWGRSEVNELGRILMEDEIIAECVNGEYTNGFALLVTTNHRLLLVDKKPFLYLTVEDVRYEMITEFNYNHRFLNATINIYTANKTMTFTSWNQHRLRKLLEYIQARVLEMRQQQHLAQQFSAAAAAQFAQMSAVQAHKQYMLSQQQSQPLPQPAAPQALAAPEQPAGMLPPAPATTQPKLTERFASGRSALGTYTRSKLPRLRRPQEQASQQRQGAQAQAESGEVFQDGYPSQTLRELRLPYEYEI
jgi:hypothetical protein